MCVVLKGSGILIIIQLNVRDPGFRCRLFLCLLTAFLDGLVAPVGTVSGLVAHFAHLDTLPAATLELLWPVALSHCGDMRRLKEPSHHSPALIMLS